VLFTGTLQGEELAAAYASSDLFVFPSRTDTFGNVVLEAQASGLPVIVSDRCGAHEIVTEEGWGLVVDTAIPGPLAEAMATLSRNAARRGALRRLALETVGARAHGHWAQVFWNQILGLDEGAPADRVAGHAAVPD
jgi:glycosyltransferase involved in cell wall biosynthesis